MPFMTVAGITLSVTDVREEESEIIGEISRTFNGTLRSQVRAEKRAWSASILEMTSANFETLRSAVAMGVSVTVAGDFIPSSIVAKVRITQGMYEKDGTTFLKTPNIRITQV